MGAVHGIHPVRMADTSRQGDIAILMHPFYGYEHLRTMDSSTGFSKASKDTYLRRLHRFMTGHDGPLFIFNDYHHPLKTKQFLKALGMPRDTYLVETDDQDPEPLGAGWDGFASFIGQFPGKRLLLAGGIITHSAIDALVSHDWSDPANGHGCLNEAVRILSERYAFPIGLDLSCCYGPFRTRLA
ncbi:hypothetical protein JXB02_04485 [Candidatus Woesearchaeota archaeon]|nr:hypothetical protein [Candidatus Woesearchaeota archaeon]